MKYNVTASRILKAMADAGITQQELSDRSGISKSSISHYVNGSNEPGNKAAYAMSKILQVSPLWLMGLDVEVHNVPPIQIIDDVTPQIGKTIKVTVDMDRIQADNELLNLFHNATPSAQESVMILLKNSQKEREMPLLSSKEA